MNWLNKKPRKSARVLIIKDGKVLLFLRKRHSRKTGEWIEYYSIPGGGIDGRESPEQAAIRELREEMGVVIEPESFVAHRTARHFEHYVFTARIVDGEPTLQLSSEEAASMSETNQYIVRWVPIGELTRDNLRYYADYLEIIQRLGRGEKLDVVLRIKA